MFKGINQIGFCLYQSLLTFLSRENKISSFYNSSIHKILHCFISWPLSVPASLIDLFPLLQHFFFNGSFQSACKYTQVFLIDKKSPVYSSFHSFVHVCLSFPAKLLERTMQPHWNHFLAIQFPSYWHLVNTTIIPLKFLIKTHQRLSS